MLSCNLIIKAFCDRDRLDEALELYRHILVFHARLSPGIETCRILTKALVDAKRLTEACDLALSSRSDIVVLDILMRGLHDADKFSEAHHIFDVFGGYDHNAIAIDILAALPCMEALLKKGNHDLAMKHFATLDKLPLVELQPFVGNRVLKVLMEHGKKTEAWDLFKNMIEICDAEAVDIMWKLCSENNVPFHRFRKTCYRTILARLCQQGNMSEAEKIFVQIEQDDLWVGPDVSTFRAMINGYVMVGRIDDAIKMLNLRKLAIHRAA